MSREKQFLENAKVSRNTVARYLEDRQLNHRGRNESPVPKEESTVK